jgi:uncharacterized membrane protein YhaH (DUF805 family)
MIDAVKHVYKNYATFTGRAGRREFWFFQLFTLIILFAASAIIGILGGVGILSLFGFAFESGQRVGVTGVVLSSIALGISVLLAIWSLASLVPSIAVHARRFRDANISPWFLFLAFVPVVGVLIIYIMAIFPSSNGSSSFDPNGSIQRQQQFNPNQNNDTW